jgi:hypothetical protein
MFRIYHGDKQFIQLLYTLEAIQKLMNVAAEADVVNVREQVSGYPTLQNTTGMCKVHMIEYYGNRSVAVGSYQ